jgi:hypothetical protein
MATFGSNGARSLENSAIYVASTPKILNQTIDATGWSETAELKIN